MENQHFSRRLNILRAGVLGANDGIISIAGVVIGVASATSNIWFIFLSGLSAILAGAFSMAGGEYVSVSTQKDTEQAAVEVEKRLLEQHPDIARKSLYDIYIAQGECETAAEMKVNVAFYKNPLKHLVEEKYGIEMDEFTNPWHAAYSSFIAFAVGSLPPTLSVMLFPKDLRIVATVIVVALSLLLTGYVSAKLGKAPVKAAMLRNLGVGLLTMTVTYLMGQLFHV
ncbi:VIT1/CCC1 transporter family protein [Streptococcus saliviloxodontae]|uniref:VIT1/CCC1 family predicted Fe2+/Mn2+ transporter n=1 Tax=Streptococcus saliviloxodontae TaxID=1349416 RepID=A0ABS2PMB4_9STRE|nr:VIT family protein [Streptococcus saliviloxodontae]MBM7636573.1 VIT1/CCC1 family predicted Fe2+/Mn2+ transporter [Streptococcus saliviloxodontae]